MELRFVPFPVVATRANDRLLPTRPQAGVTCQPVAARIARAKPLLAVWRLDPHTRRLEVRWAPDGAMRRSRPLARVDELRAGDRQRQIGGARRA
jgi:hypothetical protein